MFLNRLGEKSKVIEYLERHAGAPALERGLTYVSEGRVRECSRSAHAISGVVEDERLGTISLELILKSASEVIPRCSVDTCSAQHGSWCPHAVSLFLHAAELGFLSQARGFAAPQHVAAERDPTAGEIASALEDLKTWGERAGTTSPDAKPPRVELLLDAVGKSLSVQVCMDGHVQEPAVVDDLRAVSPRALDGILLTIVDDLGRWDEDSQSWHIASGNGIATILGLIPEFSHVYIRSNRERVLLSHQALDARMRVRWSSGKAHVQLDWVLAGSMFQGEVESIIGDGPLWAACGSVIHPLSPRAERLAPFFQRNPELTFSYQAVGPLLETLLAGDLPQHLLYIEHPESMPAAEVGNPKAILHIERRGGGYEHFSKGGSIELIAQLELRYPPHSAERGVVILPNRARERSIIDHLLSLGFEPLQDKNRYIVRGDSALDVLSSVESVFPSDWSVSGVEDARRAVRFVDAAIDVSIAPEGAATPKTVKPSKADGTSKIKRAAAEALERVDWFDCRVSLSVNNASVPLNSLFKGAQSDNDRWVRLDSGAFARVPSGSIGHLRTLLGMLDVNYKMSSTIRTRVSSATALGLARSIASHVSITADSSLQRLSQRLDDFQGIRSVRLPASFKGKLRSYQAEGVNWLNFLNEFGLGGILADEMGLGKTVQTLALIEALKAKSRRAASGVRTALSRPALVVAPTSVITNWRYEAQRFAPKLKTLVLHGADRKRSFGEIEDYDLIITSYALLRRDRYELERCQFSYVILDEAQHIKNPQAATTTAAKSLRASWRLALSGTPTENRPLELWSIMDFLMPGFLGSYEFFRTHIERPILESGTGTRVLQLLRDRIRPFVLRRTKEQVEKELPPKIETVLRVPMTQSQHELYSAILSEARTKVFDAVEKRGIAGATVSILAALLRLRQVCNHPNSIDSLKEVSGYDSGKFDLLVEILEEAIPAGRKILLFGQFREMLAIIRRHLDEQAVSYLYLDGSTKDRQTLVDRFNSDPTVRLFLISLKAGGLGLNLTAADTVIIYDPWWNPAVEQQAVDRAHRIGQRKSVNVYRLVTEDSIEQKIMDLKRKKSVLVDALINEGGAGPLQLSRGELESLFAPLANVAEGEAVDR